MVLARAQDKKEVEKGRGKRQEERDVEASPGKKGEHSHLVPWVTV